jgi:exosortase A-associated hydrolase 2
MTTPAEPGGLFLTTPHGRSFCMRYPPVSGPIPGGSSGLCVLVVPPFAEEMNKTRRMWTLLAAALAQRGVEVLIPDLHGTGESDGDFADARWEHWIEDLVATCRLAREDGATRIVLVAVRLGALLALDFLRHAARQGAGLESAPITQVILWQPVVNGEQFLTQFLRLKLAAGMRQQAGQQQTTSTMRARMAQGESIEVAGYELSPALARSIDALNVVALASESLPPISWLEVSTSEPPALTPVGIRTVEALRRAGAQVETRAMSGEPFWALQEITVAPQLVDATVEALAPAPEHSSRATLHA